MTTRAEFVATVRGYVGTTYHHQGRVPGVGMDCPAPLICAAWAHGLKPRTFDVTGYPREPDGVSLRRLCEEHLEAIAFADAQLADVLLCCFRGGHPQHLGILTDPNPARMYWIHANGRGARKEVMESRLDLGTRYMQLVAAYRVPGLT